MLANLGLPQWCSVVSLLIGTPIWVFLIIFLRRHEHLAHYQKRGKQLIWGTLIHAMLIFYYMNIMTLITDISATYSTMWPFCMVILCSTLHIFSAGRRIHLSSNLQRQQELLQWKSHLNPKYRSNSFIMRHINVFGNAFKISIICFMITSLLLMIHIIGWILLNENAYKTYTIIVGLTNYFIFSCVEVYLIYYSRIFNFVDFWGISKQYKHTLIFSFGGLVYLLIVMWIEFEYDEILTLTNSLCNLVQLGAGSVSTLLPFRIYKNHERRKEMELQQCIDKNIQEKKQLIDVMGSNKGYTIFMKHLCREFAAENLLYLTVLFQFERFLLENNIIDQHGILFTKYCDFKLPNIVPICDCFQFNDAETIDIMEMVKNAFIGVYEKYIQRSSAELEVNISYDTASQLSIQYNNVRQTGQLSLEQFQGIWSNLKETAHQVYRLLTSSHERFRYFSSIE